MQRLPRAGLLRLGLGLLLVAGCRPEPEGGELASAPAGAPEPTAAEPAVQDPAAAAAAHIYYDLTAFEWYAQGQPLRFGGRAYLPEGRPVVAEVAQMRYAGAYDGVVFFVPRDAPDDAAVYVRVFERYWQPFVTTETASANAD